MARSSSDTQYNDDYADDAYYENEPSMTEQLDLQHYMRILRKFKWPITLFTAAVTALAGYYAFTATPVYNATSTLLIESQGTNVVSVEELVGVDTDTQDYYETQFELLRSRGLAKRVVEKLNLWNHPELSVAAREAEAMESAARDEALGNSTEGGVGGLIEGMKDKLAGGDQDQGTQGFGSGNEVPEFNLELNAETFGTANLDQSQQVVIANFMRRLSISPVRKTKLVKISYESADPVLAANVANTMGEQYITSYLDAKMELTTKASSWLNERLAILKQTLDASEDRLIAFKQENGLVDVGGSVGRINENEVLLITAELASANSELSGKQDLFRDVQALQGQPQLLETIPSIQADPLVQNVKIQQGQAQRQLDELLNRYGERHPRVVDAKSQLATLNGALEGHINRVVGTISKDFQLARQRVASIRAKLNTGKEEIQAIGTKKFKLDALERETATNQAIYDTFYTRITEANSADGLETANARVSDFALPPVNPIKPKKQLIIALAALASLVLSMLMAFLYEQMDDTIKGTADIERKLGLKLLGILPLIKNGLFSKGRDLPLNPADIPDKKGTFNEAVNTARTAICLDDGDAPRKVITITSSVPGEGKSTASINLAYSLAQLERVLLIDCDMRRPTVAKAAGLDKNVTGLSNLITGTATARECIKRGAFDGSVDILPSGPIPEQPLELLSSKRFEKILEQLCQHYDRIVIDSAPTQAVSDALVLGKLSDAVVYIIKSHDTSIELVKRGVQRLKQSGAPIAGVLITQVDIDKITSYGGDYYYQGYYDYYGYTEKEEKGQRGGKLRLTAEELQHIKSDDSDIDLDLDYGYRAEPRARRSSQQRPAEAAEDFEQDGQLDLPKARRNRAAREADTRLVSGGGKRRFRDDLDVI